MDNEKERETSASLLAEGWRHVAYYDEGQFHWVSGIAPRDCELYQRVDPPATAMQDNVTQAEIIVARHIDAWGWGPLDRIEGLAEHKLAVDACAAGLASTTAQTEAVQKLVEQVAMSTAEIMRAVEALPSETNEQRRLIAALKRTCDCNRQALAAHRESQP